jgi:hypothetical protein
MLIKPPVCLSVCICAPIITFEPVYENLYGVDAIEGDLDEKTFNPIPSTTLKLLRFKVVRWMHHSAFLFMVASHKIFN